MSLPANDDMATQAIVENQELIVPYDEGALATTLRSFYPWPRLESLRAQATIFTHPPSVALIGHLFEIELADIREHEEFIPRGPRMESEDEYFVHATAHTSPLAFLELTIRQEARLSGSRARYIGNRFPDQDCFVPPPNLKFLCRHWFAYAQNTGSAVYNAFCQGPIRPLGPRYDLYATIHKPSMRMVYFKLPTCRYRDRLASGMPGTYSIARHVARMGQAPPVASYVPEHRRPHEGSNDYPLVNLPYLIRDNVYADSRMQRHPWYNYTQSGKAPYLGRVRGPFRQTAPVEEDEWPAFISHGDTTWLATLNTTKRGVIRTYPEEIEREATQDPPFSYLMPALTRAGIPFLLEQPAHLTRTLVEQIWRTQRYLYDISRVLSAISCPNRATLPPQNASIPFIRNYLEKHASSPLEKILLSAVRTTHAAITHRQVIETLAEAGVPSPEEMGTVPRAWQDIHAQQRAINNQRTRGTHQDTIRPPTADEVEHRLLAIPTERYPWVLDQLRSRSITELPPREDDWALIIYQDELDRRNEAPPTQPPEDPDPPRYRPAHPMNSYDDRRGRPRRGSNRPYNGPRPGRRNQPHSNYRGPKYGPRDWTATSSTYNGPLYGTNNRTVTIPDDTQEAPPPETLASAYSPGGWTPRNNSIQVWNNSSTAPPDPPRGRERRRNRQSPIIRPRLQENWDDWNRPRTPSTSGGGEDNPIEVSSGPLTPISIKSEGEISERQKRLQYWAPLLGRGAIDPPPPGPARILYYDGTPLPPIPTPEQLASGIYERPESYSAKDPARYEERAAIAAAKEAAEKAAKLADQQPTESATQEQPTESATQETQERVPSDEPTTTEPNPAPATETTTQEAPATEQPTPEPEEEDEVAIIPPRSPQDTMDMTQVAEFIKEYKEKEASEGSFRRPGPSQERSPIAQAPTYSHPKETQPPTTPTPTPKETPPAPDDYQAMFATSPSQDILAGVYEIPLASTCNWEDYRGFPRDSPGNYSPQIEPISSEENTPPEESRTPEEPEPESEDNQSAPPRSSSSSSEPDEASTKPDPDPTSLTVITPEGTPHAFDPEEHTPETPASHR